MNEWKYVVYGTFLLAGLSVYLLLPKTDRVNKWAGLIFGAAALVGAGVLSMSEFLPPGGMGFLFYLSGGVAVVGAVKVITHEKPVYSALYFVLVVLSIAPLLVLQGAEFLAVALVIIYAGAILVTYVFVIMLSQQSGAPAHDRRSREPLAAVVAGFTTTAVIAGHLAQVPEKWAIHGQLVSSVPTGEVTEAIENTTQVGSMLLTRYVVALELGGVLLLAAMIGAIAMSRKRLPMEARKAAGAPPGQIGREVPPF